MAYHGLSAEDISKTLARIDSIKKNLLQPAISDSLYVEQCLNITKLYDELNLFDSMQNWLNNANEKLPHEKINLQAFTFHAYQSIAYYYNNLLQLDLFESKKVFHIAKKLNDTLTLATGYNYMGLSNSNIGNYSLAIPYFKQGIAYAKQPPYPKAYTVVSKPHNLLGNLSEAFFYLKQYDSALQYAQQSLTCAQAISARRGTMVAQNLLAQIYLQLNRLDSSEKYNTAALQNAYLYNKPDIALLSKGIMAKIALANGNIKEAKHLYQEAINYLSDNKTINYNFSNQFYNSNFESIKKLSLDAEASNLLLLMNNINLHVLKLNDEQITRIVNLSINNEKNAFDAQLSEAKQKAKATKLSLMLVALAFAVLALILYSNRLQQRKKIQEHHIKSKLSKDLHDSIGATLSGIKVYMELVEKHYTTLPESVMKILKKVSNLASEAALDISDLVWALKPDNEKNSDLEGRIKNYGNDILNAKEIRCSYQIQKINKPNPELKRNIYLITKEAFNNIAKYSRATEASMSLYVKADLIYLEIKDNGIGFNLNQTHKGNGLYNIEMRCRQLRGEAIWQSAPQQGTSLHCKFPLHL